MSTRKTFLLRLAPELYDELHRWADADLRSVNAQIEFLLRDSLKRAGRNPKPSTTMDGDETDGGTN